MEKYVIMIDGLLCDHFYFSCVEAVSRAVELRSTCHVVQVFRIANQNYVLVCSFVSCYGDTGNSFSEKRSNEKD